MHPLQLTLVLIPGRILHNVRIDNLTPLVDPRLQLSEVHRVVHHVLHGLLDISGLISDDLVHEVLLQRELGIEQLLDVEGSERELGQESGQLRLGI